MMLFTLIYCTTSRLRVEVPAMLVLCVFLSYIARYSNWVSSYNILGFPGPFYSLGILGPFHFLGHLWPISFFPTSYIPMGFLGLITILYFWVYWLLNQSHLLIPLFGLLHPLFAFFPLLMILTGLLLHYLGLSWAHLLFLVPFYYFTGL